MADNADTPPRSTRGVTPAEAFFSIGGAVLVLADIFAPVSGGGPPPTYRRVPRVVRTGVGMAGVAAVTAGVALVAWRLTRPAPAPPPAQLAKEAEE